MVASLTRALLDECNISSRDELSSQQRIWFDYADSSNQRGHDLVTNLEANFTGPLRGKRVLDIGCGFGGCAIAAGRRGASVVGLDLSERYLRLAALNLADTPGLDVRFANIDVTVLDSLRDLGTFDLIIADNVIEHVQCPARLIAHSNLLLRRSGRLYITAPNFRSIQMVDSECHFSMLAASLLTPKVAEQLLNAGTSTFVPYEVSFYYDFSQYVDMFARYALGVNSLLPETASTEEVNQMAVKARDVVRRATERDWGDQSSIVHEALHKWLDEFETDFAFMNACTDEAARAAIRGRMMRDFGYGLWYFVATKPS